MTIFVLHRNGDVHVYPSVREAGAAMESPDVESGEYLRAFDEKGDVFSIEAADGGTVRQGIALTIKPGLLKPTGSNASSELHDLLRKHLTEEDATGDLSLEGLVAKAVNKLSDINSHRWLRTSYLPRPGAKIEPQNWKVGVSLCVFLLLLIAGGYLIFTQHDEQSNCCKAPAFRKLVP